ncbi:PREDICTED: uncharacterized protein DDB_G0271670-like [Tarenaya hassleriana]|uniref:uncharacterized protein DDB_G0271670-like n=1 Tax=Tarenaya hassleriana TaxID=28532 RepID=UPI00053C1CBF|nr:PREDICTED: uncharacterized protein DDB_G0271670-like [Tarenaya hassleriana]
MAEVKDQEMGSDGMQCSNHPYTKNPGGICAFCLQEKLGKLVSSPFPLPRQLSSSSSCSPSFRSDSVGSSSSSFAANLSLSLSVAKAANNTGKEGYCYNGNNGRVSHKLPFLLAKKKQKKMMASSSSLPANRTADIVYRRSKSTTTPRTVYGQDFSPRKRGGFWSFLHLYSSKPHTTAAGKKVENFHHVRARTTSNCSNKNNQSENGLSKPDKDEARANQTVTGSSSSSSKRVGGGSGNRNADSLGSKYICSRLNEWSRTYGDFFKPCDFMAERASKGAPLVRISFSSLFLLTPITVLAETPGSGFERKVSRSRSVGCGSRSFSGDFFERISSGFGDCTLRRVESQREGANKAKVNNGGGGGAAAAGMRDMVRCGGIFGGFMMMTSSSSSSSSSSSADHHHHHHHHHHQNLVHGGRNRSWGWAFASPMRAFTSTSTTKASSSSSSSYGKDGKRGRTITESTTGKNTAPSLDSIPSLLVVRS